MIHLNLVNADVAEFPCSDERFNHCKRYLVHLNVSNVPHFEAPRYDKAPKQHVYNKTSLFVWKHICETTSPSLWTTFSFESPYFGTKIIKLKAYMDYLSIALSTGCTLYLLASRQNRTFDSFLDGELSVSMQSVSRP